MIKPKDIKRVWAKEEARNGAGIPQAFRDLVMADWDPVHDDITDLEDLEALIESSIAKAKALTFTNYKENTERLLPDKKKRYQKCFERRLFLVEYILKESHSLNFNILKDRTFSTRKRINWKQIYELWNKAYPNYPMRADVIKTEFYRAIKEPDLQREFFEREDRVIADMLANFSKAMEQFRNAIKVHFPHVDDTDNLAQELEKSPLFKGLDVRELELWEIVRILDKGGKP